MNICDTLVNAHPCSRTGRVISICLGAVRRPSACSPAQCWSLRRPNRKQTVSTLSRMGQINLTVEPQRPLGRTWSSRSEHWDTLVPPNWRRTRSAGRLRGQQGLQQCRAMRIDNRELLIGDCVSLICFALYKQITALIFLPSFPGWLAPLSFNPVRFLEFVAFTITLVASWSLASLLVGGYRISATADLPTALERTCAAWLISMPIAACQLVLTTAADDHVFVTDPTFAVTLPLAASGPGEPLVTAAGVLGIMCIWRSFYTAYLDFWNNTTIGGSPIDRYQDSTRFLEAVRAAVLLSIAFCILLRFLGDNGGEEQLAAWWASSFSAMDLSSLVDSYYPLE
eukprot:jgi/Botrbrau1/9124/Bobra.160_3s0001.1